MEICSREAFCEGRRLCTLSASAVTSRDMVLFRWTTSSTNVLAKFPSSTVTLNSWSPSKRFIKVARDRLRTNQWIKIMKQYFGEVE